MAGDKWWQILVLDIQIIIMPLAELVAEQAEGVLCRKIIIKLHLVDNYKSLFWQLHAFDWHSLYNLQPKDVVAILYIAAVDRHSDFLPL